MFPFEKFDAKMDGTGVVSTGAKKYGGMFFTSVADNAQFYTEYFICKVKIDNLEKSPTKDSHSPTVLRQAVQDGKNYVIQAFASSEELYEASNPGEYLYSGKDKKGKVIYITKGYDYEGWDELTSADFIK